MSDRPQAQQKPQLYFPPPPTTVLKQSKVDSKSKSLRLNFASSRLRSSTDTTSITSSAQQPPKPILKKPVTSTKRPRQGFLLTLLVLSFTILILSMIFAYCAALPHSDNIRAAQAAAAAATAPTTTSTVQLSAITETPTADLLNTGMRARDTPPKYADDDENVEVDVSQALAEDVENQERFGTSHAMAALSFYTATLPFLTLTHASAELLVSLVRPETSQGTRFGDVMKGGTIDTSGLKVVSRRRVGTLLSFAVSVMLCIGWIVMQMFWVNCEIKAFGPRVTAEAVCPVQIRGHRMGGVSELSIGKVVLGFVVVVVYLGYCVYLVKKVGVFSKRRSENLNGLGVRMASFRRRARFANGDEENSSPVSTKTGTESVVIGIDMDKETR